MKTLFEFLLLHKDSDNNHKTRIYFTRNTHLSLKCRFLATFRTRIIDEVEENRVSYSEDEDPFLKPIH